MNLMISNHHFEIWNFMRRISKEEMKKAKEIERKKWLESIKKMNAKKVG